MVQADWSPDGQQVAFVRLSTVKDNTDGLLLTLPLSGGSERLVATFPGEFIGNPRWSPDGSRITVHTSTGSTGAAPSLVV
ncbi:MAG: PD40 domain-containing protein [Holophagaceae bacterium]|nr:PD40 domain-containing protein [Holophagaceae bacterium]